MLRHLMGETRGSVLAQQKTQCGGFARTVIAGGGSIECVGQRLAVQMQMQMRCCRGLGRIRELAGRVRHQESDEGGEEVGENTDGPAGSGRTRPTEYEW